MFEILVGRTGDLAEAETYEAALLAAKTMISDYIENERLEAQQSIVITFNGTVMGIASAAAQLGVLA